MSATPFASLEYGKLSAMRRVLRQRLAIPGTAPILIIEYNRMLSEVESELAVRGRQHDAKFAVALARALVLIICMGFVAGLSGCVSTNPGIGEFSTAIGRNKQIALTALMAMDTAQTVTIGRSPNCLHEANPLAFFGDEHPSAQQVLITGAFYGTAHWLFGSWLDRKAERSVDFSIDAEADISRKERWRSMRTAYQLLTFIGHGTALAANANRGIRPFSAYECGGAR